MPNKFTIEVDDKAIRALTSQLNTYTGKVKTCFQNTINKYALLIQGDARKNLEKDPRRIDEGTLRASIQALVLGMAAEVATNSGIAPFVHWGTGIYGENPEGGHRKTPWVYYDEKRKSFFVTEGMKPNKFLLNAFNKHKDAYQKDLETCLQP